MYSEQEINLITLSSFEELSYKNAVILLSDFQSFAPDFEKYRNLLIKSFKDGVYNKLKGKFYSASYRQKLLQKLDERGIKCVTYFSELYPEPLKHAVCPPLVLYCKGNTDLLKTRMFAIVGSRRTLPNVLKECSKISAELSRAFTVVTGLADGADTAAIEGAIGSGQVISVLANGFDHVYPAMNEPLLKKIEERGLVITEYTPQIQPKPYNFPVRNRIIAGLAEGTLIVSAGKKSGALITAGYANDADRLVYAFPYGPGVSSGVGCNNLIKTDRAKLVECADDIFYDFNITFKREEKCEMSEEELAVYDVVSQLGDAFVAQIADKIGKLPYLIIPTLTSLEMKGLIVRLGGNRFSAVQK